MSFSTSLIQVKKAILMVATGSAEKSIFELRRKIGRSGFLRGVYILKLHRLMKKEGCFIGIGADFKSDPILPHGLNGIFISDSAEIGESCTIFQQVTIGSNKIASSRGFGAPKIGDNCLIGAGAKIIGNVKVGNNVRIGANCVVVVDVSDNSTVVCGEMRVIQR